MRYLKLLLTFILLVGFLVPVEAAYHRDESMNTEIDFYGQYGRRGKTLADLFTLVNANPNTKYHVKFVAVHTLTADRTWPTNVVKISSDRGGGVTGNYTVTLDGQFLDIADGTAFFSPETTVTGSVLNDFVVADWFGAIKGDGLDDTSSMQSAHNLRKPVKYGSGRYRFTTLDIYAGGIIGNGNAIVSTTDGTTLYCTSTASENAIEYLGGDQSTSSPPIWKDFYLLGETAKTGGAAISMEQVNPASDRGFMHNFTNVHIRFFPRHLDLKNSSDFTITDCKFFFYKEFGVRVANAQAVDVGDSGIHNSHFFNGNSVVNGYDYGANGTGILQESSGGLRVIGNKFNGGANNYLLDSKPTTGSTSILMFTGNTCENTSHTALRFVNNATTAASPFRWSNFVIVGNHFAGNEQDIHFEEINEYLGSSYWDQVVIDGNVFYHTDATEYVMELESMRNFEIGTNVINGNFQGAFGIRVHGSCSYGYLSRQSINGITTTEILNEARVVTNPVYNDNTFGPGLDDLTLAQSAFSIQATPNYNVFFNANEAATLLRVDYLNDARTAYVNASFSAKQHIFNTQGAEAMRLTDSQIMQLQQPEIQFVSPALKILAGSAAPEGAVTANAGSIYLRSAGGAGTSFYVKESGSGNTGWVGK